MDDKDTVEFLKQVLKLYSPSGEEQELTEFLCSKMKQLGFNSWIDAVGNVIGEIGDGHPILLFIPHVDTVPGYIEVQEKNGVIAGRGAVDAKSSLVAMIAAASYFVNKEINGKIQIVGVVAEESDSKGIQHLLKKDINADYIVIGEPSGCDGVTFAYKGRADCKISVRTETGHTGACWQYRNAIETAFELWNTISKGIRRYEEEGYFASVIPCLTFIQGGQYENIVPNFATLRFEVRYPPKYTSQELFSEINSYVKQFKDQNQEVDVELSLLSASEAIETDRRSNLMKAFKNAIRHVVKKHPNVYKKTGSSDMNEIGAQVQVPIVAYGPGDSKLDHSPNEFIEIEEFLLSIEVLKKVISEILNTH